MHVYIARSFLSVPDAIRARSPNPIGARVTTTEAQEREVLSKTAGTAGTAGTVETGAVFGDENMQILEVEAMVDDIRAGCIEIVKAAAPSRLGAARVEADLVVVMHLGGHRWAGEATAFLAKGTLQRR